MLRKNKNYTQEKLSSLLDITPQAISKWEQAQALPDIGILPALAKIFSCSIDFLVLGDSTKSNTSPYDDMYNNAEYYWGIEPSSLAEQIVTLRADNDATSLLDIGSGEGRDAVYFANNKFCVDALEISAPGIEKIKKLSLTSNSAINTIHADMLGYQLTGFYDVIYSCGSLQFIPPEKRLELFTHYKQHTSPNGLNAHLVFVEKPFIALAPDWQVNEYFYKSGELADYYADWEILYYDEQILSCNSMNIPHEHAVCSIIAKNRYL